MLGHSFFHAYIVPQPKSRLNFSFGSATQKCTSTMFFDMVISFDEVSFKIKKVTIEGDKAIAVVDNKEALTVNDKTGTFGPKGETHKIVVTATVQDTWIKTPVGWKQKSHEKLSPNKYIVDGKPFERKQGQQKQ